MAFTTFPNVDTDMPHWAPALGAMPVPTELGGAVSDAIQQASGSETLGPAVLGVGTAAVSGGLVGGVAAGSWRGAAIGASFTAGLWGLFTLFGTWRAADKPTRWVLGGSTAAGLSTTALLVFLRWRRKRARLAGRR